jgi:hypothetical protein
MERCYQTSELRFRTSGKTVSTGFMLIYKYCGIAFAEVTPSTSGIAVVDNENTCRLPNADIFSE